MAKSIIASVIGKFVEVYPAISSYLHLTTEEEVLKRINSGDCGTASICIGNYLESKGISVKYVTLEQGPSGHAVIEIDGEWYDTDNPQGIPMKPSALSRFKFTDEKCEVLYLEPKVHLDQWVHFTDDLGLSMIDVFPSLAEV